MQRRIIEKVIILLTLNIIIASCSSPIYFFTRTYNRDTNMEYQVTFNQLNIDENKLTNILETAMKGYDYTFGFNGIAINYNTGVLYATYGKRINPLSSHYQSYLLAIDLHSNELLFEGLKYCEGFVTAGLSIDQTTGDIHFLNHSSKVDTFDGIVVDWLKWNPSSNTTTMVQPQASLNTTSIGITLYNSLTQTLWLFQLSTPIIYAFSTSSPTLSYPTSIFWGELVMNSKTGDMFVANYQSGLFIERLSYNETNIWATPVCGPFDVPHGGFVTTIGTADFDYASNSYVIPLNQVSGQDIIAEINLDTCVLSTYLYPSPHNSINVGMLRYYPNSN